MSDFSFEIKSSLDLFNKLLKDYEEFCKDKTSSSKAINCAMISWHLTEWIYEEYKQQLSTQYKTSEQFKRAIKLQCSPSMHIMQDITNGTKHSLLSRGNPIVKETKLHKGSFSNDFSRDFDISTLEIKLDNGSKIYFEDAIESVVQFWKQYLSELN